jgi:glutathione synthase/RimK-type ligase-like ATP-grasp enzyme/ribosomal protein S18 acetylase RimI-like enzyme
MSTIRLANQDDLPFLITLEKESFTPIIQVNIKSIKRSLLSKNQSIYLLQEEAKSLGALTLRYYKNTVRLTSIAILKDYRKQAYGKSFLITVIDQLKHQSYQQLNLEVDASNLRLIEWYESIGFKTTKLLHDFYGVDHSAYQMTYALKPINKQPYIKNIVIIDKPLPWLFELNHIEVVYAKDFIKEAAYQQKKGFRIFNLCENYAYQSMGYYVSLLSSARNLRVIPHVSTLRDITNQSITKSIGDEEKETINQQLKSIASDSFSLTIYFGYATEPKYQRLAKTIYKLFEAPFLRCTFHKHKYWELTHVDLLNIHDLEVDKELLEHITQYFNQKRFVMSNFKQYAFDLAILIDPDEKNPPSDHIALNKFKKAAEGYGFFVEFITKDDYHRLNEFDALFIRTTTNVSDYTYEFSRYAYSEGLVVIDDPFSILKCSNKLFLHELMQLNHIKTPKTLIIDHPSSSIQLETLLGFPMILKQPDSAFSLGVFKVTNPQELISTLEDMLKQSALVIAQEYIKTDYDWRIGVLNNEPIYACKYFMAKNHWQIYNWNSKALKNQTGNVLGVPINQVPKQIVKEALKACKLIGDGFYGVDLKQLGDQVYLIEVNDNPSIDYLWEDTILHDDLYKRIIKGIYDKIEASRTIQRKISQR